MPLRERCQSPLAASFHSLCVSPYGSHMLFAEIIVKNLRRRIARTALTTLGLAVAVTATTTLWNIAWGYADSAKEFYSSRGVDIVVVRAGVANRLTSSLRADLAAR